MNQPFPSASNVKAASSVQQQHGAGWELDIPIPILVALIMVSAGLIIWGLTAWANARQAERNRFTEAAASFREAFTAEIVKIENCNITHMEPVCDILHAAYERHSLAVENFRPLLKGDDLERLNSNWYTHCYDECDDEAERLRPEKWSLFLHFTRAAHTGGLESAKAAAVASLRLLQSSANAA